MAFAVSPNPTSPEKPRLEPVPDMFAEIPADNVDVAPAAAQIEQEVIPETEPTTSEMHREADLQASQDLRAQIATPTPAAPAEEQITKSELEKKIDHILEEDLRDLYANLPEKTKPLFKKRGEEAAHKIKELVESTKASASKIAEILRGWLKLIPAAGAYFMEQLIKIKTDQLMELAHTVRIAMV